MVTDELLCHFLDHCLAPTIETGLMVDKGALEVNLWIEDIIFVKNKHSYVLMLSLNNTPSPYELLQCPITIYLELLGMIS